MAADGGESESRAAEGGGNGDPGWPERATVAAAAAAAGAKHRLYCLTTCSSMRIWPSW